MKKQTFIVTLTFEDKISGDNDILEIANSIARAIKNETNGIGISPQNSDNYTKTIEVKSQFLEETININAIE